MPRTARAALAVVTLVAPMAAAVVVAPAAQAASVAPRAVPQTLAATTHVLAVTPGGNVRSWGSNTSRQLGRVAGTEAAAAGTVLAPAGRPGALSQVVQVAAGGSSSYALRADGTVWAWGANDKGQLGNKTTTESARPVQVQDADGPLTGIVAIAAGGRHALALGPGGQVWAWGDNSNSQLGPSPGGSSVGTRAWQIFTADIQPLRGAVQVAAGDSSSYALLGNGTVLAWGAGGLGQLGNGGTNGSINPRAVRDSTNTGSLSGVAAIGAGAFHAVAVLTTGQVQVWGADTFGQIGDGGGANALVPRAPNLPAGTRVTAVYAGPFSQAVFARTQAGDVYSWGRGSRGVDAGSYLPAKVPGLSGDRALRTIAVGISCGFASRTNGALRSWGTNNSGRLGDGSEVDSVTPIPASTVGVVGPPKLFVRVAPRLTAPPAVGRIIRVTAGVWGLPATAWAYQWLRDGRAIRGATRPSYRVTTADRGHVLRARVAAARYGYPAGAATTGLPTPAPTPSAVPGRFLAPAPQPSTVATTSGAAFAVTPSGSVRSWGDNTAYRLGRGTAGQTYTGAGSVSAPSGGGVLDHVAQVTASGGTGCALRADGTVWCWGANSLGQLGNGATATVSARPVRVRTELGPLTAVVAIASGKDHALALRADGTVWAWGYNGSRQLGAGSSADRSRLALQVAAPSGGGALRGVVRIAAGSETSYAVLANGTAVAWGDSGFGQRGDGTFDIAPFPTQIRGAGGVALAGVVAVAAGRDHAHLLTRSGACYAMGANYEGQSGLGGSSSVNVPTPTQVRSLPVLAALYAGPGSGSTFALGRDGTLFGWGANSSHNLGDGTTDDRFTPVRVLGLGAGSGVRTLQPGGYSTTAVLRSGAVRTWGKNTTGTLGNGGPLDETVPTPSAASTVGASGPPRLLALRAPALAGVARVGRVLSVSRGVWGLPATAWAYQWYRDGHAIRGASRPTYKVSAADRGHRLTARVVATRYGYPAGAAVAAARVVAR